MKRGILIILTVLCWNFCTAAPTDPVKKKGVRLEVKSNRPLGVYSIGERAVFTFQLLDRSGKGCPGEKVTVKIWSEGKIKTASAVTGRLGLLQITVAPRKQTDVRVRMEYSESVFAVGDAKFSIAPNAGTRPRGRAKGIPRRR